MEQPERETEQQAIARLDRESQARDALRMMVQAQMAAQQHVDMAYTQPTLGRLADALASSPQAESGVKTNSVKTDQAPTGDGLRLGGKRLPLSDDPQRVIRWDCGKDRTRLVFAASASTQEPTPPTCD